MRNHDEIERVITKHGDTVWRVCSLYFRQQPDAQDAFQDTMIKFATYQGVFQDDEHIKAWLIRVATNICKDLLKAASRTRNTSDDGIAETFAANPDDAHPESATALVVAAMQDLTDPPRTPVYLALYEGYPATEVAEMLDMPVNTVYSHIARGKKLLKEALR